MYPSPKIRNAVLFSLYLFSTLSFIKCFHKPLKETKATRFPVSKYRNKKHALASEGMFAESPVERTNQQVLEQSNKFTET